MSGGRDSMRCACLTAGSLASLRWRSRFGRPASVGQADPTGRFCLIPTNWLKQRLATSIPKPTPGQLIHTALFNSIPFIGFGFLDNVIMITAGDYIEASVGVAFGISTMAAAALGNAVSDVAGIGSAFYVEMLAMRIGVPAPSMSPEQHDLRISHWFSNIGRAFGVALGCILGMFPLFFLPGHNKREAEEAKEEEAGSPVMPIVKAEVAEPAAAAASAPAPAVQPAAKAGAVSVEAVAASSAVATTPVPATAAAAAPAPAPVPAPAPAPVASTTSSAPARPQAAAPASAEASAGRENNPKLTGQPK